MPPSKHWSVVAVSCPHIESALAVQRELEIQQRKGNIAEDTLVLAVDDPRPSIGSGSATLNVLLHITQHMCMKAGLEAIEPTVLDESHILIIHMGRQSPLSLCGSAFVTLPPSNTRGNLVQPEVHYNLNLLLSTLSNTLCVDSPPGVWVSSCDMILSLPQKIEIDWSDKDGVCVISVPATPEYAKHHSIIKIGDKDCIEDIFYRPTDKEIEICQLDDGRVPVLPVIIFLPQEVSKKFILLYTTQPLENCTFVGLDNGAQPITITFLFDILLCMAKDMTKDDFVSGRRSTSYGGRKKQLHTYHSLQVSQFHMHNAREALWNELRDISLKTIFLKEACYDYLFPNGTCHSETIRNLSTPCNNGITNLRDTISGDKKLDTTNDNGQDVEINSILSGNIDVGRNSVIVNCELEGSLSIGENCLLAGLKKQFKANGTTLSIPRKIVMQDIRLNGRDVTTSANYSIITIAFGLDDNLTAPYMQENSSFCNERWSELFKRTGILPTDLWTEESLAESPCLLSARLFPVRNPDPNDLSIIWWIINSPENNYDNCYSEWRSLERLSIEEIVNRVSFNQEFLWRRQLFFKIGSSKIKDIISKGSMTYILPFLRTCVMEGFEHEILAVLDEVAASCTCPSKLARTLSYISDVLSIMAGVYGSLRSGPGKNPDWKKAIDLLEEGKLSEGVEELHTQRERWMGSTLTLIRCARQYEGAEQALIRQAVLFTKNLVNVRENTNSLMKLGEWVIAEAPARVDLSGGWSDTPPITYEHGGTVTNVAIKIDGKRPIGAKIRKIPEFKLVLVLGREDGFRTICSSLEDIRDFSNPSAPGALLKSAFLCTDTVQLDSDVSLAKQLENRYGCGFELHTWSDLPHGSGLGTSSILGGVACAAILRILGRGHDHVTLAHLVIHLEQMLTTGGGWQDQVGGLFPGVKTTKSSPRIPIVVQPEMLKISEDILHRIAQHTALVYTGKTRLAKYILQDVIRRWYAGSPEIIENVDELTRNAEACADAWQQGDLEEMGRCLNAYRKQKRIMAPDCEHSDIHKIIDTIQPCLHACCLAGAGGGGFLFVITKKPNIHEQLKDLLRGLKGNKIYSVHRIEVDTEGLTVQVQNC